MSTSVQLITVNGKKFATGLLWQQLTKPRAYMQEARELGRRENMDVVAIRTGRVLQAGLASKSAAGPGVYSFAAALAGILGDDWIAVFEVDPVTEQFAIAGVNKNGVIIPGCDDIGSRSEVEERLRSDFSLHQFTRVICPDGFGFGGEDLRLADVLTPQKLKPEYKLKPLVGGLTRRQWITAAAGVVVLLLIASAAYLFIDHKRTQAREVAAAKAAAEAQRLQELTAATGKQATPEALAHPWATQPKPQAVRRACLAGIDQVPLSLGGWTIESASCTGGMVQMILRREGAATINGLLHAAGEIGYRIDNLDEAGESATLSLAASPLQPGGDDVLLDMSAISNSVRSHLQSRSIPYSFVPAPAPVPPTALPGEEQAPPAVPDWKTYTLSISSRRNPAELLVDIEDLPGMRLQSIAVRRNGSELEWTLTGEFNGK